MLSENTMNGKNVCLTAHVAQFWALRYYTALKHFFYFLMETEVEERMWKECITPAWYV